MIIEGRDAIFMQQVNPRGADPAIVLEGILVDVRDEDRVEWETAGGMPLREGLRTALGTGEAWVAYRIVGPEEAQILAAGGAIPSILRGVGIAWMILTKDGAAHPHRLQRNFFIFLRTLLESYPTLHAWADERNTLHLEWMLKCGFTQTDAVVTIGGFPFILFTYTKEQQAACASP